MTTVDLVAVIGVTMLNIVVLASLPVPNNLDVDILLGDGIPLN